MNADFCGDTFSGYPILSLPTIRQRQHIVSKAALYRRGLRIFKNMSLMRKNQVRSLGNLKGAITTLAMLE